MKVINKKWAVIYNPDTKTILNVNNPMRITYLPDDATYEEFNSEQELNTFIEQKKLKNKV